MAPTVVILCGGRGTRLQEHTHAIPKALVEIGGRPILWHVMSLYASQGFEDFLLCTGYLGEQVEAFVGAGAPAGTRVRCVDTGPDTPTGGRIARVADRLAGTFCVTYTDGVADLDLRALLAFHNGHGALATMTVVRPELPFGVTDIDGDGAVRAFARPSATRASGTAWTPTRTRSCSTTCGPVAKLHGSCGRRRSRGSRR
jgi:glucose-1-phosphate cytidylyltransferase